MAISQFANVFLIELDHLVVLCQEPPREDPAPVDVSEFVPHFPIRCHLVQSDLTWVGSGSLGETKPGDEVPQWGPFYTLRGLLADGFGRDSQKYSPDSQLGRTFVCSSVGVEQIRPTRSRHGPLGRRTDDTKGAQRGIVSQKVSIGCRHRW